MMRVVHIVWSGNFGGIERLVSDLSRSQNCIPDLEVDIMICKAEGGFLEKLKSSASTCHTFHLRSAYDISIWKYLKMLRILKTYDIIHFHGFNPIIYFLGILANSKIIYTEHGNFGFGRKKKLSDSINKFLKKYFLNRFSNFITFNSKFTKDFAEKIYHFNSKTYRAVIYNGIFFGYDKDSPSIIPEEFQKKISGKFVVGTCSRFAGFKRIDRLISAFYHFQKCHDSLLLIVGDGVLRPELEKLVETLHLKERTLFTGFQSNIIDYQKGMDVCVFPSQGEPFGLVAVETLALGKPTLVYKDGGGITEVVEGVEPLDIVEDDKQLVARLTFYADHKENLEKDMSKRTNHARMFDITTMARNIHDIYKQVLCAE